MKKNLFFALVFLSVNSMFAQLKITTEVCSDATSVRLTGPFWGWNLSSGPEAISIGDGLWEFTFNPAPTVDMEYLLIVDGFQENLIPGNTAADDWSCTPVTDSSTYANRLWVLGSGNVSNTYSTCSTCEDIVVFGCTDLSANNYNPNATQDDASCLFGISLPLTFEGSDYAFVDFEGGASQVLSNPNSSGINTSANVVEIVRNPGSAYAGMFIPTEPIDFSSGNVISIKVHSPEVDIPLLFKLDSESGVNIELTQTITVANEWHEMLFDLGDQPSDTYTKVVIIFNPGTIGDGSANATYYFDDIQFATGDIPGCTDEEANNYNASATQDDGTCTYGAVTFDITVNPCAEATSVRLTGPFWAWSDLGGPEAVKNSNGTWTFNLSFEDSQPEDMQYLFVVDSVREDLVAAGVASDDWSCTPVTDYFSYANRLWTVGSGDVTGLNFGTCGSCGNNFSTNELEEVNLIYPNPSSDFINVGAQITSLEMYSITGQKVMSIYNTNNKVDISMLPMGIYTIKLINTNGNVSFNKFSKENK